MIKYKLICKNCDFSFDSWFASSKEYEKLKSKNFLNCHKCNSQKVEKTLMAPQLINRNSIDNLEKLKSIKNLSKVIFIMWVKILLTKQDLYTITKKIRKKVFMAQLQKMKFKNLRKKELKLK